MEAKVVSVSKPNNPIFAFLNGRKSTRNGIQGVFIHEVRQARYPYLHWKEKLRWVPTAAGQKTEQYLKVRRELGDDWESDLTDCIDEYCSIAVRLGFKE